MAGLTPNGDKVDWEGDSDDEMDEEDEVEGPVGGNGDGNEMEQ